MRLLGIPGFVLHVTSGDAQAMSLREAKIEGEVLPWRDMLCEGPIPNFLREEADWRFRAEALAAEYGLDGAAYVADATDRLRRIEAATAQEIVLWFDDELFCQANCCYLLDWLARAAPEADVSLVLDAGAAPVGGLRELLAERVAVDGPRRALARAFWNAIASPDASGLPRLLGADLAAWPGLALGLRAQVQRFPDARGLCGVESTLLGLLSRGPTEMAELFPAWAQTELGRACGFGDSQVEAALRAMPTLVATAKGRIALTPEGERVAAGRGTAPARERWIGGVRLVPGKPGWRREGAHLVRA